MFDGAWFVTALEVNVLIIVECFRDVLNWITLNGM